MDLSEVDIRLVARIVAEKLGPAAGIDDVKDLVAQVVERLSGDLATAEEIRDAGTDSPNHGQESLESATIVVNAFGLDRSGLEEALRSYVTGHPLWLKEMSSASVEAFRSVVAIIDYSDFKGDINQLKFELSRLCESLGFKAIVQDSRYYGA